MKLISKQEFLNLPCNTLYSDYDCGNIQGLFVKHDTLEDSDNKPIDFVHVDLLFPLSCHDDKSHYEALDDLESGKQFLYDVDNSMREGLYDDEMRYIVYDNEDIAVLIKTISECIK